MKRSVVYLLILASAMIVSGGPSVASAEVNVNIGIGVPLPALVFPAPPALVVIPGTYVYSVVDIDQDVYFYQGFWYRPHGGVWYRAREHSGPWGRISAVPPAVMHVPPDYRRHIPPGHEHMPYGHVKKNWRSWERDRHWDRHEGRERKREEREERKHEHEKKGKGKHHRGD